MKKLLLTLTLLLTLGFAASAAEVTITDVTYGKTQDGITYTVESNGGNSGQYSNPLRVYLQNKLVFTSTVGYISKIVFTTSSATYVGSTLYITADGVSVENAYEKSGSTVTITLPTPAAKVEIQNGKTGDTNTQLRISEMVITTEEGEFSPKCDVPTFSVNDGAELFVGQTVTVNKGNADACELLANGEPVEGLEYTIPETAEVGSTITLTANSTLEGGDPAEATASINVTVVEVPLVAEFVFSTFGWSNQTEISTVNMGVVTLNFDKKSNSTTPKYFTNNNDVRLYGGGALTISVDEAYYITKIESVYKNTTNDLTPDCGSFNSDYTIWTNVADDAECYESTVTFTESGTKDNRSWASIVVSYAERPTPVFAGLTHEESFGKTVVRVEYMLHLNNHNDSNPYTVELTVDGKTFINKEHTDATIVEETANAPMRVLNPDDVASDTTLKGTVMATGLEGETPYGEAKLVAKLGSKVLGTATIDEFTAGTTGIEDVTVENEAAAEYFNMQGIRVAEPQAGQIYIVRRGAKATKELVK